MEQLRDHAAAALVDQGVLASLKAQLRAAVASALREEQPLARNARREWLLGTEEGVSAAALARELLAWAGLDSTLKVFDAELDHGEPFGSREQLTEQLSVAGSAQQPLLLSVLQAFLQQQGTQLPEQAPRPGVAGEAGSVRVSPASSPSARQPGLEWKAGGAEEGAFIKALHLPDGPGATPDASPSQGSIKGLMAAFGGGGGDLSPAHSPPLRSPTRRALGGGSGEASPGRKSVEELKKQLLSQGLKFGAPGSPERRSPPPARFL